MAQILQHLRGDLPDEQAQRAAELLQRNLTHSSDWIVLNVTMDVLAEWAKCNRALAGWLRRELERLCRDQRNRSPSAPRSAWLI